MLCDFLSGNCLVREYFAEKSYVVFFWKQPGKREHDVWQVWTLERTLMFGKDIRIPQPIVAYAEWYWFALPFFVCMFVIIALC